MRGLTKSVLQTGHLGNLSERYKAAPQREVFATEEVNVIVAIAAATGLRLARSRIKRRVAATELHVRRPSLSPSERLS
jgi:hypothetical protein